MAFFKKKDKKQDAPINRRRNMMLLAVISITVPIITSAISLHIYRSSGDIYLDRSRPGFIAEGETHNEEDDGKEQFASDGAMDGEAVDEYLKQLKIVEERLEGASESFDAYPLSDEALGIEK